MTPTEIREARTTLGLTGAQMGAVLGYGEGARMRVSELERGVRQPSESVVRLLRAYLDGYRPDDWPVRAAR